MPTNQWSRKLEETQANNLPLIISGLLCVQILSAARDPIVIGSALPNWLILVNGILILLNIGLAFWVRSESIPRALIYPVVALAFFCAGLKAIASAIAQTEPLPFYLAMVMLGCSLCFLSMRYLIVSMALVLLTWTAVALRFFPTGETVSTVIAASLGAALSIFVLHKRLAEMSKVFELEQRVHTLESILPMCASCKKTRDHTGKWQSIEAYIEDQQTGTQISHGSCPTCTEELYGEYLKKPISSDQAN